MYLFFDILCSQITKEESTMKTKQTIKKNTLYIYRHYRRPCPNAAEPSYFINKLVDGMLAVVTGLGSITFFAFLVTM